MIGFFASNFCKSEIVACTAGASVGVTTTPARTVSVSYASCSSWSARSEIPREAEFRQATHATIADRAVKTLVVFQLADTRELAPEGPTAHLFYVPLAR